MISIERAKIMRASSLAVLDEVRKRIGPTGELASKDDYWQLGFIEGKLVVLADILGGE